MRAFTRSPVEVLKLEDHKDIFIFDVSHGNIDPKTVASFGEEWSRFKNFSDKEIQTAGDQYFDIVNWDEMKNAQVLDVGCGSGRWTKYVAPRVAHVDAIDPSISVYKAATLLKEEENVRLSRVDVDNIPFEDNSFDFVFSLGVLHHIPVTVEALRACIKKVKPGGKFLLYIYYNLDNRGILFRFLFWCSNLLRKLVSRLPNRLKRLVCDILAFLLYMPFVLLAKFTQAMGWDKITHNIPLSYYRNMSLNIIRNDALDRFGTPLEQRFSRDQITEMMTECGLGEIQFSEKEPFWHAIGVKQENVNTGKNPLPISPHVVAPKLPTTKRVLFILPYPLNTAPSQRFRVEQFLPLLDKAGIEYELHTFLDNKTWDILYSSKSVRDKVWGTINGFRKRNQLVRQRLKEFDYVFIHREAAPLGPPVFERFLHRQKAKIIYDFDDAIWMPNVSEANKVVGRLKQFNKITDIVKLAYKVVGGNDFLVEFAKQNGATNTLRIPTVVDMENKYFPKKVHHNNRPVVGWTGSHSTLKYIEELVPQLQELQKELDFEFIIIADKNPELALRNYRFVPWQASTEVVDLLQLDIGLMPLEDTIWSKGKCGFKIIQYQSVGIPAIASDVGVNGQIIEDGKTGLLVRAPEDWITHLRTLIKDSTMRKIMGESGKYKMEQEYSIQAVAADYLSLFK